MLAQELKVIPLPADHRIAFIILDVVIILVVARLVGRLALKVGQPRVVGEIVAGVLLGPSLLGPKLFNWGNAPDILACSPERGLPPGTIPSITSCLFPVDARIGLNLLGSLALALFMFLVGLELDLNALKGRMKGILLVGFGVVVLPIASAFAIGPVLHTTRFAGVDADGVLTGKTGFILMLGAMLAVTAFPVAARILQEKGLANTALGAIGIAAAAVVTILMFLAVGLARGVASDAPASTHIKRLIGTAIFLVVMVVVVRPLMAKFLSPANESGVFGGEHFAITVVVVLLSAYVADRIGINVIVGGFVAGAVMPRTTVVVKSLQSRLTDVVIIVLLPIFLGLSGLATDFTKLGWAWLPGLALVLVVAVATKWIGGLLFGRLGGLSWAESNALGVLMNCRGLLVLVVALVALNAGVISPQLQVGGVLVALVTTAMTGPLIDRFLLKPESDTEPVSDTAPSPVPI